jgi:molecular chaperone DnaK
LSGNMSSQKRKEKSSMPDEYVLGIDLGTTMSCMAVIDRATKRPRVLYNREGRNITPSVVLYKGDEVIVGERAKRSAKVYEQDVALCVKRHMCEPDWIFIDSNSKEHRPEEISALILKKLKEDAESALGEPIKKAVITVPAYFQDMERNRTKHAGELAGLQVLTIINEPTAAAIAYGLDTTRTDKIKVLVYDLGGGTFDVTVMEVVDSTFNVLASGGDRFLGGMDFDETVVKFFQEQFQEKFRVDPLKDLKTYQDFLDRAEQAKVDLSTDTEVTVGLSAAGNALDVTLTREKFNELISPLIDHSIDLTEETLDEVKLAWSDINKILLIGGSTRIPLVQERVKRASGKETEKGVNPDEAVAVGAAIVAAQKVGEKVVTATGEEVRGLRFRNVTAHSLGVIAWDRAKGKEINSIIIKKNTPIPAEEIHMFTTVVDNQTDVQITILQGEVEEPEYCTVVGEKEGYLLAGIPPRPQGEPRIEITARYDEEGIIHLRARELDSGKELKVQVTYPQLLSKDELRDIKARIEQVRVR